MWNDIAKASRTCGSAPMYTWVSEVGRIELSGTTFLNGVSKAANMLRDGLEMESLDQVFIDLGNHWQSPVWIAAALSVQASLTNNSDGVISVVNRESVGASNNARELVLISRDPFGMPEKDLDSAWVNGSQEVRGFGDVFSPMGAFAEGDKVLGEMVLSDAKSHAHQLISEHEIIAGSRIAVAQIADLNSRALWQVFVPVIARCSVVLLDGNVDYVKTCEAEHVDRLITVD